MINLLRHSYEDKYFLTWDCETESLSLSNARPWLLGWQLYKGFKKIEEHEYYINWPELNVSKEAARITNFSPSKVKEQGKDPKFVIDLFNNYLYNENYKVVFANGLRFDCFIHNTAQKQLGLKSNFSYLNRSYDTISYSKAFKLNIKPSTEADDFLPFQYRMSNFRQKGLKTSNSVMAKEFGMEVDETKTHSSTLYDCDLTWFVFKNLINKVEII